MFQLLKGPGLGRACSRAPYLAYLVAASMQTASVQRSGRMTVSDSNIPHAGDPLWWGEEDLKLLKGTRLGAAAEHHARQTEQLGRWRQQLCSLQAELGGPDMLQTGCGGWALSHEALRWAKSTVWSRAFNIPYLGVPPLPSYGLPCSCSRSKRTSLWCSL